MNLGFDSYRFPNKPKWLRVITFMECASKVMHFHIISKTMLNSPYLIILQVYLKIKPNSYFPRLIKTYNCTYVHQRQIIIIVKRMSV